MPSFFNLTLDTLAPQGVSLSLNSGAATVGETAVTAALGCSDASTAGYTMKFYGDIYDSASQNTVTLSEEQSVWETFHPTKSLILLGADGLKTVRLKVRDDLHNTTSEITAQIRLDTVIPTVIISGPDAARISEQPGKDTSTFTFTVNKPFLEYKTMLVPITNSDANNPANAAISTVAGSTNTSGAGTFAEMNPLTVVIKGADLKTAAGGSDGAYIIKVFVYDGIRWSV